MTCESSPSGVLEEARDTDLEMTESSIRKCWPSSLLGLIRSLLALGAALFFLIPAGIGQLLEHFLGVNSWWSNLAEGAARLALLIGYIWAIGLMPDVKRVYAYHGAEHKTINAFEDGAELTPEVVATYSREHARCGTAFLLTLVLISVLVFSLLGPMPFGWKIASRLLFIPVIAMLAYEYIRWTANHLDSPFVRALVKPNLALQRLTTSEPSLDILEVGIAAFNAMRAAEEESAARVADSPQKQAVNKNDGVVT